MRRFVAMSSVIGRFHYNEVIGISPVAENDGMDMFEAAGVAAE